MRSEENLRVRVYAAGGRGDGFWSALCRAAGELAQARGVLWRLFLRDLTSQCRQKVLGFVWAFLHPLLAIASFLFLYHAEILRPGELSVPYPLYVVLGITLWGFFLAAVQAVGDGLRTHGELLLRTGLPKLALTVAGLANVVFAFGMQMILIVVILVIGGVKMSWAAAWVPVLLLPLTALAVAVGLMLAVLGSIARDVPALATSLLNLLMYLTPVVYVADFSHAGLRAIIAWNPMSYLIDAPRSVLLTGALAQPAGYAVAAGFVFVVLALSVRAFYLLQDLCAERL